MEALKSNYISVEDKINNFIDTHVKDFAQELFEILWISEELEDKGVLRFYPEGLYMPCKEFLSNLTMNELSKVYELYTKRVGRLVDLKWRIKNLKNYYNPFVLAEEALATIILKEYQKIREWQVTYGVTHEFAIDLIERPEKGLNVLIEGLEEGEYTPVNLMTNLYGDCISGSIEPPSSLYDVFAYMENKWEETESQTTFLRKDTEGVFTPDSIPRSFSLPLKDKAEGLKVAS